jgi:hypothetical protein
MLRGRVVKRYIGFVIVVLFLTAIAKFWSMTGSSGAFDEQDPITRLSFQLLMLMAATLEIGVAAVCIFAKPVYGLLSIAWLSSLMVTYRVCLAWVGWRKPCSCLGNLTDALHISPQLADNIMKALLAFMFIGSVSLLILHRRGRAAGLNTVKMPVPEI